MESVGLKIEYRNGRISILSQSPAMKKRIQRHMENLPEVEMPVGFMFYCSKRHVSKPKTMYNEDLETIPESQRDELGMYVKCKSCDRLMEYLKEDPQLMGKWFCSSCGRIVRESTLYNILEDENTKFEQRIYSSAGELSCRLFQGNTYDNFTRIFRNYMKTCPFETLELDKNGEAIKQAKEYIKEAFLYEDYYPAYILALGCFVHIMDSLCSAGTDSKQRLVIAEKERARQNDGLFQDVGFDTVGRFLRLCYNNFIIDYANGCVFFKAFSAISSGSATKEDRDTLEEFKQSLGKENAVKEITVCSYYDTIDKRWGSYYLVNGFMAMVLLDLSKLEEVDGNVSQCQNPECKKFFIAKNANTKYCEFPSPQKPERTCRSFYSQWAFHKNEEQDDLRALSKKAACRLYMDKKRHPEYSAEIEPLLRKLAYEQDEKIEKVLKGDDTKEQFEQWLNSLRRVKGRRTKK